MKNFGYLLLMFIICGPYIINAYKLSNCDFEADYKCEALHTIGVLVPPSAFVTVWFDDDSGD